MATWKKIALATGTSAQFIRGDGSIGDGGSTLNGTGYVKASTNSGVTTISYLNETYSLTGHNHDGSYALIGHNHDGSYALIGHNHSLTYQPLALQLTRLAALTTEDSSGLVRFNFVQSGTSTFTIDNTAYITGLSWDGVTGKPTEFPPITHTHPYQAADGDLTAIAGLTGTSGFLKKTGTNTWALDDSTYSLTTHNHNLTYQPLATQLTKLAALLLDSTGLVKYTIGVGAGVGTFSLVGSDLNGTGYVKASGSTITYLNETYSLSNHTHSSAELVDIPDWRTTNYEPNQFAGQRVGFHFNNTDTLGGVSDYWMAVQTVNPWGSWNGSHRQQQMLWGGSYGLSFRYATSAITWSGWSRLYSDAYRPYVDNTGALNGWGYASYAYRSNGNAYYQIADWVQINNNTGIFWPSYHGLHLYPNQNSYGALQINGSKNGWSGIHFNDSMNALMMNSNESGHHREGFGWQFVWDNGTLYCYKNSYGGGTRATVWDSSNFPNQAGSRYTTDFNSLLSTGFYNSEGQSANAPNSYGQLIVAKGVDTGLQIAGGYNSDSLFFRGWWSSGAGFTAWRTVIHSGNIASQTVYYASIAGYASTAGTLTTNSGVSFTTDSSGLHVINAEGQGGNLRLGAAWGRIGIYNNPNITIGSEDTIYFVTQNTERGRFDSGGNGFAQSSFRAPIFYDSNDTAYYVDPNNLSNISRLTVANAVNGVSIFAGGTETARVCNDDARKAIVINATLYPAFHLNANNSTNPNHGAYISMSGSLSGGGFRQWSIGAGGYNPAIFSIGYNDNMSGNGHYGLGDNWSGNDAHHGRLTIDIDGTTKIRGMLYVNGTSGGITTGSAVIHAGNIASQSVAYATNTGTLNGYGESAFWRDNQSRTIGVLNFSGVGGNSGNGNQSYAIYQEGGGWGYPFPDLCIGYHTGIKIGAYFGYNGIRFYNNSDMVTETFSVGNGDNHVRVANNLYVTTDIVYNNMKFTGDQAYGFFGRNVYADTINGRGSDSLELNYYDGGSVIIGQGSGTKALYAGSLYDGNNRVWSGSNVPSPGNLNSGYITNIFYFKSNRNTSSDSCPLQAYSDNGSGATMSFHRGGAYATNMGLDSDNVFRIGGWSASVNRFQMDMNGNLTMAGDVAAYSDARIKTNIKTIENALERTLKLRGVSYNRTDSDDIKTKIGVIAQEMLEVLPEVVNQDNNGMYNVSYGNIVGLLIEAIKELKAEVNELKMRIA